MLIGSLKMSFRIVKCVCVCPVSVFDFILFYFFILDLLKQSETIKSCFVLLRVKSFVWCKCVNEAVTCRNESN